MIESETQTETLTALEVIWQAIASADEAATAPRAEGNEDRRMGVDQGNGGRRSAGCVKGEC